jgi:hypothetical protein
MEKEFFCPVCQKKMEVDGESYYRDAINNKSSYLITASCMSCLIEVNIRGNIDQEKDGFGLTRKQLLQNIIQYIQKPNIPGFLLARKKEMEEELLIVNNTNEQKQIEEAICFVEQYTKNNPWGKNNLKS